MASCSEEKGPEEPARPTGNSARVPSVLTRLCEIPGCGAEFDTDHWTYASDNEMTFYGIQGKDVPKICTSCQERAKDGKKQDLMEGASNCGYVICAIPEPDEPQVVQQWERQEKKDKGITVAGEEMIELDFADDRELHAYLDDLIMNKHSIKKEVRKLKQICRKEACDLEIGFGKLKKTIDSVEKHIEDCKEDCVQYNRLQVDTQKYVIEEVEIDDDGRVHKIQNGSEDIVVNSDTLQRLPTLLERNASDDETPSSSKLLKPRKPGPASKTGYYETVDSRAQQINRFAEKAEFLPAYRENFAKQVATAPSLVVIPRPTPKPGELVYVAYYSSEYPWVKGYIMETVTSEITNQKEFVVQYEPVKRDSLETTNGVVDDETVEAIRQVTLKQLAYQVAVPFQLPVGSRVIAKYYSDPDDSGSGNGQYYVGIIGEPLKPTNQNRYLVFFDDGYARYISPCDVRIVCESSTHIWNDVHPDAYDFIKAYLKKYPFWPLVKLHVGSIIATEYNGRWMTSRILQVDNSLALVRFEGDGREEWIYRGSARFRPIYRALALVGEEEEDSNATIQKSSQPRDYLAELELYTGESGHRLNITDPELMVEWQGSLTKISVPAYAPRPKDFVPHACDPTCVLVETTTTPKKVSPLALPLFCGWTREISKKSGTIFYRAPCGVSLETIEEVARYLEDTDCRISIDHFSFNSNVDCLSEFVPAVVLASVDDISEGKEQVPIECVNSVDKTLPRFEYLPDRIIGESVPLNLNTDFLVCCDCKDNCRDKEKCACWKLTMEGISFTKLNNTIVPTQGYQYRRLEEMDHVLSGIFECNDKCQCKKTCYNRVIQNGVQWPVQIFKTKEKGWGIRALFDIPEGSFICFYTGEVLNEQTANQDGMQHGDEYLASLDFIETCEVTKENFESDVTDIEDERKYSSSSNSESESERNRESKITIYERASNSSVVEADKEDSDSDNSQVIKQSKKVVRKRSGDRKYRRRDAKSRSSKPKRMREVHQDLYGGDGDPYLMNAKQKGNFGRFINHSCWPNLNVQNVFVDSHDLRFPRVAFFTSRVVKAGSELTWHYNYQIGTIPDKVLLCRCNTRDCRGRLL